MNRLFQVIFRQVGGIRNLNFYVEASSAASAQALAESDLQKTEDCFFWDWEAVEINELESAT